MSLSQRLAVKEGLDYQIPKVSQRLPYFLGSLTLTGILIQIVTGVYLSQFYTSDPQSAHQSVLYIITRAPLARRLRAEYPRLGC